MHQIEHIKINKLSFKHKIVLIGLLLLMSLSYLLDLSDHNIFQTTLAWLGTILSFVYLWLRPEMIDLKKNNFAFKPIDWVIFLSIGLLISSSLLAA